MKKWMFLLPIFAAVNLIFPGSAAAGSLALRMAILPGLGSTEVNVGWAYDINHHGRIVGCAVTPEGQPHAVLWEPGPHGGYRAVDLGTLGGGYSCANGINDHGEVVGSSFLESGPEFAFLWRQGRMINLGCLATNLPPFNGNHSLFSTASAINNAGQIVGSGYADDGYRGFLWQDGFMRDLGSLGPSWNNNSVAEDINQRGQLVGSCMGSNNEQQAAVWWHGLMDFVFPYDDSGNFAIRATGINEPGHIIGQWGGPVGGDTSFLWRNGVITTFGGESSFPQDANNQDQVVGYRTRVDWEQGMFWSEAFFWDNGVELVLPKPADSPDNFASAINDHGQIVGWVTKPDRGAVPVIWTVTQSKAR